MADKANRSHATTIELKFTSPLPLAHRVNPNPFVNELTVEWDKEDAVRLELLDATGRLVRFWNRYGARTSLSMENLADGPYQLRIIQGACATTHKLIKQP